MRLGRKDSRILPELAVATAALVDGLELYSWTATRLLSIYWQGLNVSLRPWTGIASAGNGIDSPLMLSACQSVSDENGRCKGSLSVTLTT